MSHFQPSLREYTRLLLGLGAFSFVLAACASDQQNDRAESATATESATPAPVEAVSEDPVATPNQTSETSNEVTASEIEEAVPTVEPERWAELKSEIRAKFPTVEQLSVHDLSVWLDKDSKAPVLLDVREHNEFQVSHLKTAQRARDLSAALLTLKDTPKNKPVVLYCSVGYRSSQLAEQLQKEGFSQVFNLEGSIFEWANQGEQVVFDDAEVSVVHPYDSDWGQLLRRDMWSTLTEEQ